MTAAETAVRITRPRQNAERDLITLRYSVGDQLTQGPQKISGTLWLGSFLLTAVDLDLPSGCFGCNLVWLDQGRSEVPMLGDPLSLEVHASSITITMPGTDYWVTYEKRDGHPRVALVRSWMAASVTTPAIVDFRSRSRRAAIKKAR